MRDTSASDQAYSQWASQDVSADLDPDSCFWRTAPAIHTDTDNFGKPRPGYRMEVRSRWTDSNLYFLFLCPYEELNLKPNPNKESETFELWNWDVAEVFIGSDPNRIRRYKEFEVSPQGEWVDLDIDLDLPRHEDGWKWNSNLQAAARIDPANRMWYAFMRIPYVSVDSEAPRVGRMLRANFFLSEGPKSNYTAITWKPTHAETFHVPEVFGTLTLIL